MPEPEPLKLITTTLHHPTRTEAALSVVYTHAQADVEFVDLAEKLDVEIEETIDASDADRILDLIAHWTAMDGLSVVEGLDLVRRTEFEDYFRAVLEEPCIIVEQSPP